MVDIGIQNQESHFLSFPFGLFGLALGLIQANLDLRFLRWAHKKLEIPDESLDFGW